MNISDVQLECTIDDPSDGIGSYCGNIVGYKSYGIEEDEITLDGNNSIIGNKNNYGWENEE